MSDAQFLSWFQQNALPVLERNAPERLSPLLSDAKRFEELLCYSPEAIVCCLGGSGVGKSTLINALVAGDHQLLPAGGTGPLTALATTVRYGETRRFRATYHKPNLLWQVILPISGIVARSAARTGGDGSSAQETQLLAEIPVVELSEDERLSALTDAHAATGGDDSTGRLGEFLKMARKLVTGDQFANVPEAYLVDCLRIALGQAATFGNEPRPEDLPNLDRIRTAIVAARDGLVYERSESDDRFDFKADLDHHAAGNLSPLIANIEVEWPSDLLSEGITVVDLPGVGVAGDMYRGVTQEYVRNKARAILLVVDRSGMGEGAHSLLRSSGYWDRLVGAAYEPEADPCTLLIAVTKVDEVVLEEFGRLPREKRPRKADLLREIVGQMKRQISAQTASQLASLEASSSADLNDARDRARQELLRNLQVFPVVAPDYRRLLADDEDDQPLVAREAEQTQVPQLASSLRQLAADLRRRHEEALGAVRSRFVRGVRGELDIVESQWREKQRLVEEIERLRVDLDNAVRPWREELANRQGGFREFLQVAVQAKISALVQEAREAAEADIRRYLKGLRDAHWATLRAAVSKGGTFHGSRKIDLPHDISDRFQEPIAGVWGMKLLRDVRKRTTQYAQDCAYHVTLVSDWARGQGNRVNRSILELQESRIKGQAEQLKEVGKEAADELRAVVRAEVSKAILRPIRRRCEKFVADGNNSGRGVKNRILEMFDELALESTKAAAVPAREILNARYKEVQAQIDAALAEWQNPIEETVKAILSSNEKRIRRDDEKRRAQILAELEALKVSEPAMPASEPR
jgi:hypothetical protein